MDRKDPGETRENDGIATRVETGRDTLLRHLDRRALVPRFTPRGAPQGVEASIRPDRR
jgi:hypothetical protein